MSEIKPKRSSRKKIAAANSPAPSGRGSVCGHSGCDDACKVRYAGPTSHPRDHLLHQAARGARHVWLASVVAGLAVVLTGAIAYTAVQAESAPRVKNLNEAVAAIWRKLDNMERLLKQMNEQMGGDIGDESTGTNTQQQNGVSARPSDKPNTGAGPAGECAKKCYETVATCVQQAAENSAKEVCVRTGGECLKACRPTPSTTSTATQF